MEEENLSYGEAQEEIEDKWGKYPISARWFDLISRTENIGEALDRAFAAIEANNPELQHVLTATQYGDKRVLSDATCNACCVISTSTSWAMTTCTRQTCWAMPMNT